MQRKAATTTARQRDGNRLFLLFLLTLLSRRQTLSLSLSRAPECSRERSEIEREQEPPLCDQKRRREAQRWEPTWQRKTKNEKCFFFGRKSFYFFPFFVLLAFSLLQLLCCRFPVSFRRARFSSFYLSSCSSSRATNMASKGAMGMSFKGIASAFLSQSKRRRKNALTNWKILDL